MPRTTERLHAIASLLRASGYRSGSFPASQALLEPLPTLKDTETPKVYRLPEPPVRRSPVDVGPDLTSRTEAIPIKEPLYFNGKSLQASLAITVNGLQARRDPWGVEQWIRVESYGDGTKIEPKDERAVIQAVREQLCWRGSLVIITSKDKTP